MLRIFQLQKTAQGPSAMEHSQTMTMAATRDTRTCRELHGNTVSKLNFTYKVCHKKNPPTNRCHFSNPCTLHNNVINSLKCLTQKKGYVFPQSSSLKAETPHSLTTFQNEAQQLLAIYEGNLYEMFIKSPMLCICG